MKSGSKRAKCLLSIVYGLFLLYVLFFRSIGTTYPWTYAEYLRAMHNFIPLKSVYVLLTTPVISTRIIIRFLVNFIGNIVLFVPWGGTITCLLQKITVIQAFCCIDPCCPYSR